MLVFSSRIKAQKKIAWNWWNITSHKQTDMHLSTCFLLTNLISMEFERPRKATYGRTRKWGTTWDSLLAAPLQGEAAHSRNCGETLMGFCHAHGWQHLTGLCAYRWGRSLSHTKASRSDAVVLVVCFLEEATSNPLFIHWGPKDPKTAALWRNKNWCCKTYSWPLITRFSHQTPSKLGLDPGC